MAPQPLTADVGVKTPCSLAGDKDKRPPRLPVCELLKMTPEELRAHAEARGIDLSPGMSTPSPFFLYLRVPVQDSNRSVP